MRRRPARAACTSMSRSCAARRRRRCGRSPGRSRSTWRGSGDLAAPLALARPHRYREGMKSNTKSSITLPAHELRLVQSLKARLRLKSNVEVVRKGLLLLQQTTDRAALKEAYRKA